MTNNHSDIRVQHQIDGIMQWVPAPAEWAAAHMQYKARHAHSPEVPSNYENQFIVYRESNDCYMPTRIQLTDTWATYAIMDCADVKVFLQDAEPVNWYPARNYQMWAFRDFIYDSARPVRKFYASKYSSHLFFQRGSSAQSVTDIDIDGLPPNIIFSISRNDNGSVYYERNDPRGTRVRICDHEGARAGFRGFYNRITMDPGIVVTPPLQPMQPQPSVSSSSIPLQLPPLISAIVTSVEEDQCIMCYENRKNITFSPCGHRIVCSVCYPKLVKPRECPMCKQTIEILIGCI
jgi:Zinc finger, C3HC4 type (RING finger)